MPPWPDVPTHITMFDINDETPTKGEIEAAVIWMKRNRTDWYTNPQAEHILHWISEACPEDNSPAPPQLNPVN